MSGSYCMVLTTCADEETARRLTDGLLTEHLVACVQRMPVQSAYWWEGSVQHETELLLLMKTRLDRYPAVEAWLRAEHPYEVPEVIQLPISSGFPTYLEWIAASTRPEA
ncbi:MAG: divalent-cation tolerance protein CutA [Verrucomicrobiota bacterium]|jgi:periplasmic divalent cation tolerance protein|nr:divalent-cation tolerance protein CutA [Verrucomicrobiota bacterium]